MILMYPILSFSKLLFSIEWIYEKHADSLANQNRKDTDIFYSLRTSVFHTGNGAAKAQAHFVLPSYVINLEKTDAISLCA